VTCSSRNLARLRSRKEIKARQQVIAATAAAREKGGRFLANLAWILSGAAARTASAATTAALFAKHGANIQLYKRNSRIQQKILRASAQ
jgi:hypothetical protein